jgi:hypothetical protein
MKSFPAQTQEQQKGKPGDGSALIPLRAELTVYFIALTRTLRRDL